jgi:Cu-processing system ATP-binding protein
VLVNGVRSDGSGEYRRELGYMPQMARFPEHLLVGDFFRLLSELRRAEPRDDELIAELGLRAEWTKPFGKLSGGTRQKVNAAAALLFRPGVLVLDEPTAGLDPVASGAFKAKLLRARDAGCAVLVTGHVMAELEELADRVAFLSDCRLSFQGEMSTLLRSTRTRRLEGAVAHLLREGAA